mmetsp:Transcript_8656/g.14673  ORF Transcript_8656/g.14673 Transcript_8656/m.14673 type:complete len:85 (+) Transcript_8656:436-690(+)
MTVYLDWARPLQVGTNETLDLSEEVTYYSQIGGGFFDSSADNEITKLFGTDPDKDFELLILRSGAQMLKVGALISASALLTQLY